MYLDDNIDAPNKKIDFFCFYFEFPKSYNQLKKSYVAYLKMNTKQTFSICKIFFIYNNKSYVTKSAIPDNTDNMARSDHRFKGRQVKTFPPKT